MNRYARVLLMFSLFVCHFSSYATDSFKKEDLPQVERRFPSQNPEYREDILVEEDNGFTVTQNTYSTFVIRSDERLRQQEEVQKGLVASLNHALCYYAGYYTRTPVTCKQVEAHILKLLDLIDWHNLKGKEEPRIERLMLFEGVVKSGCKTAVVKLTEKLIPYCKEDLTNRDQVFKEALKKRGKTLEVERPIFWLAAICTRWDPERVPDSSYREIETYLTQLLCPPSGIVMLYGQPTTREQYIAKINEWKQKENEKFGIKRYQLTH